MEKHRWLVIILVVMMAAGVLLTKNLLNQNQQNNPPDDSQAVPVAFMTEQFSETFARAQTDGRTTILAISEKPFCACFGDKEIKSGLTLNTYNAQLFVLFEQIQDRYPDQFTIILIDRGGLDAAELSRLIELRQQLGVDQTPVLLIADQNQQILYQNDGAITASEILAVLDQ